MNTLTTIFIIVALTNISRTAPVRESPVLDQRAHARAEYLCAHAQWSHEGWGHSFKGLPYEYIGENLARNFSNPFDMQKAWMKSPTHHKNIVNPHYTDIGVGIACNVTVVLFGGGNSAADIAS